MSSQALVSGHGSPLIIVDGADFDGTNDYMLRGAGLTGASDSKLMTIVCWVRLDGGNSSDMRLFGGRENTGGALTRFDLKRKADNLIHVIGYNTSGTEILDLATTSSFLSGASWLCVMSSVDMSDTGKRHLYINDVSDLSVTTYTNDTIDFTVNDVSVGANTVGAQRLNGCLAELYFAPGQYLDFSIVANRRKFISSSGKPVYLGSDGSAPTGTAPIVYQHLADAEAVANFATNRGTGGNFTITGTLETASSSPSD